MLYKFKSRATPDLIMLELNGRRVLEIIGKSPDATGIILAEQMPAALEALDRAVQEDEARLKKKGGDVEADDESGADADTEDDAKGGKAVSLRQRVAPFADMLRNSMAAGKEVVWGV